MNAKELRRHYGEELAQALSTAGGKTRKRTFTRMVQTVSDIRGAELTTLR